MLGEIGPFTTDNFSGEFKLNPYSWNMELNILFIEQPAGVGFSVTEDIKHNWTDIENAKNLLAGVKDFFATFPNLEGRDFYVSGESYAGIFIPHLAAEIIEDTSTTDKINLKGILIGNALTDPQVDYDRSLVEFGFWRGLISIETYDKYQRHCPHLPDELRPDTDLDGKYQNFSGEVSHECNQARLKISDEFDGSDLYGIYRLCPVPSELTPNDPLYYNAQHTIRKTIAKGIKKLLKNDKNNKFYEREDGVWPNMMCKDDLTVDTFLNLDSTKEKLNIYDKSKNWTQCAPLNYEWSDSIHIYNTTLLEHPEIKQWLISGTEDGVITTIGTMRWINKIGFKVDKKWTQWKAQKQISGYVQSYEEGLVLVTIKGAGHMSPQDKRLEAKFVLDSFIKGILPSEVN
jgi:serine carboxypeptidase-like clade 2